MTRKARIAYLVLLFIYSMARLAFSVVETSIYFLLVYLWLRLRLMVYRLRLRAALGRAGVPRNLIHEISREYTEFVANRLLRYLSPLWGLRRLRRVLAGSRW